VATDPAAGTVRQVGQQVASQAANATVGNIVAVPDSIRQVGQQALTLATDIGNIVSSGGALIQAAGSGNMGFLTVPALAALTVAQIAALKNLGSQMDAHGQALGGAANSYATTEDAVRKAAGTANTNQQPMLTSNQTLLASVRQDSATSTQQIGTLAMDAQEV
jgi:hypothetical protein